MKQTFQMPARRRSAAIRAGLSLLLSFLTVSSALADSKPLLHPLFTDHAVLQREIKVPVWGWARPGATVAVSFGGQNLETTAGADGRWLVHLAPMPASAKPREMLVRARHTTATAKEDQSVRISDLLVGDVWLCSGQSNMEMGMGLCRVSNEIAAAHFPLLRLITVPKKIAFRPEDTFNGTWQPCSPTVLTQGGWGGFSATAFFFGRELQQKLNIPIGLIHSSWGGSICEAWISPEALKPFPDFKPQLEQVTQVARKLESNPIAEVVDQWFRETDPGTAKEWFKPETDAASWKEGNMPAGWGACGLTKYEGLVWIQKTFEAPAGWAGRELVLSLGPIADIDTTWVNGVAVGNTDSFDAPRRYQVPARVVKAGRNVVAIRVFNTGSGGLMGKPEQLKIFPVGEEGSALSLAGPWRVQDTVPLKQMGLSLVGNQNIPTVLYNGMIAPLVPGAIKGAIWYQGEANTGRAGQYASILPAMITDWRRQFGVGDFGFHIVSLANYKAKFSEPRDSDWAELREAQARTAKATPNCGLAVAIDIGEADDIHPRNKMEVGRRLALGALAITYGKKIEWSGPWFRSMTVTGPEIRLAFDHVGKGLVAQGGPLTGFAIAGEDRKFVWADAVIDGNAVLISSPAVRKPVAVRYGWDSNPSCNLYNKEGLPAVPFRTDDWPGITESSR